jgi:hypothetical protein
MMPIVMLENTILLFHMPGINSDPDQPDPDRCALDADPPDLVRKNDADNTAYSLIDRRQLC